MMMNIKLIFLKKIMWNMENKNGYKISYVFYNLAYFISAKLLLYKKYAYRSIIDKFSRFIGAKIY